MRRSFAAIWSCAEIAACSSSSRFRRGEGEGRRFGALLIFFFLFLSFFVAGGWLRPALVK